MIKQIQLRGISRNPSDRMTEDGGVAESLNMQIENTENVPMLPPKEKNIGLPANFTGDVIYIHKMTSKVGYIYKVGRNIASLINGVSTAIFTLEENENIACITSVGNTLVLSTNKNTHYALYKDSAYIDLGTEIPIPSIEILPIEVFGGNRRIYKSETREDAGGDAQFPVRLDHIKQDYDNGRKDATSDIDRDFMKFLSGVISDADLSLSSKGIFAYPTWATIGVTLFDGSTVATTPILLSAHSDYPYSIEVAYSQGTDYSLTTNTTILQSRAIAVNRRHSYRIHIKVKSMPDNFILWKDLIKEVGIYTSKMIGEETKSYSVMDFTFTQQSSGDWGRYDMATDVKIKNKGYNFSTEVKNALSVFYRQQSLEVQEVVDSFSQSRLLLVESHNQTTNTEIYELPRLSNYKFTNYNTIFGGMSTFNQRVLGYKARQFVSIGTAQPSAISYWPILHLESLSGIGLLRYRRETNSFDSSHQHYAFKSKEEDGLGFIPNISLDNYTVAQNLKYQYDISINEGQQKITDKSIHQFTIHSDYLIDDETYICEAFPVVLGVDDKISGVTVGLYEGIFPVGCSHFTMDKVVSSGLSIYIGDINEPFSSLITGELSFNEEGNCEEDRPNYIYLSDAANPFFFPTENQFAIYDSVTGVAISTLPLSEGQFGQYPIYAFTKSGIYAIEVNEEGLMSLSRTISRESVLNNSFILPLPQAILFSTDKGAMMIAGTQVTDLSPFMRGKHYSIEQSAGDILEQNSVPSNILSILADPTSFKDFIIDAEAIQDYASNRVLFFKDTEDYAYVLKLDTDTWHKISLPSGLEFVNTLNSFPEALAVMKNSNGIRSVYNYSTFLDEEDDETEITSIIATRPFDLGEPDVLKTINHIKIRGQYEKERVVSTKKYLWLTSGFSGAAAHLNISCWTNYGAVISDEAKFRTGEAPADVTNCTETQLSTMQQTMNFTSIGYRYETVPIKKPRVQYILLGSQDGVNFYRVTSLRGKSWKMFRIIVCSILRSTERISWIDIDYTPKFTNKLR